MVTEAQIRELAYTMWEQEGWPEGKDQEHYYRAKKKLEDREPLQLSGAQESRLLSASPEKRSLGPRKKR